MSRKRRAAPLPLYVNWPSFLTTPSSSSPSSSPSSLWLFCICGCCKKEKIKMIMVLGDKPGFQSAPFFFPWPHLEIKSPRPKPIVSPLPQVWPFTKDSALPPHLTLTPPYFPSPHIWELPSESPESREPGGQVTQTLWIWSCLLRPLSPSIPFLLKDLLLPLGALAQLSLHPHPSHFSLE